MECDKRLKRDKNNMNYKAAVRIIGIQYSKKKKLTRNVDRRSVLKTKRRIILR